MPSLSSPARMNASTGLRTHSAFLVLGTGGGRTFRRDHHEGPSSAPVPASQIAPSSIHFFSAATSEASRGLLPGGILSFPLPLTAFISKLPSLFPGITAAPRL